MNSEEVLLSLGKFSFGDDAINSVVQILAEHSGDSLAVAYSGGKDSTALATIMEWIYQRKLLVRPKNLYLVQIDTTIELPPLEFNSINIKNFLRQRGWKTITRRPKPRERLYVKMLGYGYPPANNRFWWCTRSTKQEPQKRAYGLLRNRHCDLRIAYGSRIDESDMRAARIAASCTSAGTECGLTLFNKIERSFAPLIGWRNCAIWDWLQICKRKIGCDVSALWEAYAAEDIQMKFDWDSLNESQRDAAAKKWDAEIDAASRTGCVACHIARDDKALSRLTRTKKWSHLSPYLRLRYLTDELRGHQHRVTRPDKGCAGALKLESRLWALEQVESIQSEVRNGAEKSGMFHSDIISKSDSALIRELIKSKTYPGNRYGENPEPMRLEAKEKVESLPGQQLMFAE